MNRFVPSDELLSAYLDGEVTAPEREAVERALRESAATRQSLEELRHLQADVRGLPRLRLEPDFCQQVLRQAERAMLLGETRPRQEEQQLAAALPMDGVPPSVLSFVENDLASQDGADRSFSARLPERRRLSSHRWHRENWHRVAAALAVLAPALLLIVLAARDPQPGDARVSRKEGANEEAATDRSRADDFARPEKERLAEEAKDGVVTEYAETADGRESRGRHTVLGMEGETRRLDDSSGGIPLDRLADGQRRSGSLAREESPRQSEIDPRLGKSGLTPDTAAFKKGGGEASAASGDAPANPAPVAAGPLMPDNLQKDEPRQVAGRAGPRYDNADGDGVVVVHLSVTEDAWKSGAVGKWLSAYQAPAANGALGSGALRFGALTAEDAVFMRQAEGGPPQTQGLAPAGQQNAVERKAAEKAATANTPADKKGDEKAAKAREADEERLAVERLVEPLAAEQRVARLQLRANRDATQYGLDALDKNVSGKNASTKNAAAKSAVANGLSDENTSVVQVEGAADDVYALLADLNARAKAGQNVVSLAVVPPRQAEYYQAWSALNYAAGVEPGALGDAGEFDRFSFARRREAGFGGALPGGFGGGSDLPEAYRQMFRENSGAAKAEPAAPDGKSIRAESQTVNPAEARPAKKDVPKAAQEGLAEKEDGKKQLQNLPTDPFAPGAPSDDRAPDFRSKKGKSAAERGGGAGGGPGGGTGASQAGAGKAPAPAGGGPASKAPAPSLGVDEDTRKDANKGIEAATNKQFNKRVDGTAASTTTTTAPAKTAPAKTAPPAKPTAGYGAPAPREALPPAAIDGTKAGKAESAKTAPQVAPGGSPSDPAADRAKRGGVQPDSVVGQQMGPVQPRYESAPARHMRAIFIVQVVPTAPKPSAKEDRPKAVQPAGPPQATKRP